jgi:hypothetical protein
MDHWMVDQVHNPRDIALLVNHTKRTIEERQENGKKMNCMYGFDGTYIKQQLLQKIHIRHNCIRSLDMSSFPT